MSNGVGSVRQSRFSEQAAHSDAARVGEIRPIQCFQGERARTRSSFDGSQADLGNDHVGRRKVVLCPGIAEYSGACYLDLMPPPIGVRGGRRQQKISTFAAPGPRQNASDQLEVLVVTTAKTLASSQCHATAAMPRFSTRDRSLSAGAGWPLLPPLPLAHKIRGDVE
jgi:hypothetical protein